MQTDYRFNFFVDDERKIMIFRAIGEMPSAEYVERLHAAYATVAEPWTYHRLVDQRRFEGLIAMEDIEKLARHWAEVKAGHVHNTRVAVVSHDALDVVRVPAVSPMFPDETLCHFTDYHEAMAWICAPDDQREAVAG